MSKNEVTEPGYGYRFLGRNETVAAGDEFWLYTSGFGPRWEPTEDSGATVSGQLGLQYRRAIDVGAGHRLVGEHETIAAGDEFLALTKDKWELTGHAGSTPSGMQFVYRRKIGFGNVNGVLYSCKAEIQAGEGYELLKFGDKLVDGDEYWNDAVCSGKWEPVGYSEGCWTNELCKAVRRKKKANAVTSVQGILLTPNQVERLKAILNWTVNTSGVSISSRALRDELFPVIAPAAPKKYRLLAIGEVSKPGDEFFSVLGGEWLNCNTESVVTDKGCLPVRREIDSYTGGPA